MQIVAGQPWATVGAVIAVIVLLLSILGLLGVMPFTPTVVFGLLAGLAVARIV